MSKFVPYIQLEPNKLVACVCGKSASQKATERLGRIRARAGTANRQQRKMKKAAASEQADVVIKGFTLESDSDREFWESLEEITEGPRYCCEGGFRNTVRPEGTAKCTVLNCFVLCCRGCSHTSAPAPDASCPKVPL